MGHEFVKIYSMKSKSMNFKIKMQRYRITKTGYGRRIPKKDGVTMVYKTDMQRGCGESGSLAVLCNLVKL